MIEGEPLHKGGERIGGDRFGVVRQRADPVMVEALHHHQLPKQNLSQSSFGPEQEGRHFGPAQPVDGGHQRPLKFFPSHGFNQIAGGIHLKGIQGVFPGDREEDELCRLSPFPDPPGQFNSLHVGHEYVQQVEIEAALFIQMLQQIKGGGKEFRAQAEFRVFLNKTVRQGTDLRGVLWTVVADAKCQQTLNLLIVKQTAAPADHSAVRWG